MLWHGTYMLRTDIIAIVQPEELHFFSMAELQVAS